MLDRSVVVTAPKAERSCRVTALDTGKSTGEQGNENEEFTEEGRHCRTDRLSDTTCLAVERLPNQDKH
jgi:hypothetical protein